MRLSARVIVPMFLAVLIAAGLLTFLWLQLHATARDLRGQATPLTTAAAGTDASAGNIFMDEADKALLSLRQGDLLALSGDWAEAQKEYEASVKAGGGIAALKKLVTAQLQRRDLDGARDTIDLLRREGARSEDLLLLDVLVALRSDRQDEAASLLQEAGDSPQKHYGALLLAVIQGNHDAAKTEIQAVIGGWEPVLRTYARTLQGAYDEFLLFPDSPDSHLLTLLSRALAQVQECELALPLLARAVREQDDYRDAWIVQGFCQLTTERSAEALTSLERAYALDPEKPETQYFLGRAYAAQQDHRNAITFLEYALQNGFQPERDVRRAIALEAQAAGDTSLAYHQYRALATGSGSDLASVQDFVSLALQIDKEEDAYAAAQEAVRQWPNAGKAYAILGDAAAATGKVDEARTSYEKALQLDATLDDVKEKLVNLGTASSED